ncbi:hypothetical protein Y032_0400g753 [Ancylostoma ceylanicum]|uniref:Uncharacterized protein n=1 Tax=Ancylostoma ceylanicum TaxID=53326 RepID=A0A016RQT2_9BILA|nr:hypothetical protein Y032_0400g753 [Ancylostoma ceylanicum]
MLSPYPSLGSRRDCAVAEFVQLFEKDYTYSESMTSDEAATAVGGAYAVSSQVVHVTARPLADTVKITMKRDTQIKDGDVECWQTWL